MSKSRSGVVSIDFYPFIHIAIRHQRHATQYDPRDISAGSEQLSLLGLNMRIAVRSTTVGCFFYALEVAGPLT